MHRPERFWDAETASEHVSGWQHVALPLTAAVMAMASAHCRPTDVEPCERELVEAMTWTRVGGKSYAEPNEAFWASWHGDKFGMKMQGWAVTKLGGRWAVTYRRPSVRK